jgi:hypothetical protein
MPNNMPFSNFDHSSKYFKTFMRICDTHRYITVKNEKLCLKNEKPYLFDVAPFYNDNNTLNVKNMQEPIYICYHKLKSQKKF